jgi:hypothetical protein
VLQHGPRVVDEVREVLLRGADDETDGQTCFGERVPLW